jgi:hypothetical protein
MNEVQNNSFRQLISGRDISTMLIIIKDGQSVSMVMFLITETRMEVIRTQTEPELKALISLRLEDGNSKDVQKVGNTCPYLHGAIA